MPRPTKITSSPPEAVQEALAQLGQNIRTARLRRKLSQEELARRLGVSRFLVANDENGKLTTGIGAYFGALWALDLLADVSEVADPDRDNVGKSLECARSLKTNDNQ